MTSEKARIADAVALAIDTGALRPGEKLPTEEALRKEFGGGKLLSRQTIRGALHRLAERGLVESRQGVGWFVQQQDVIVFPLHTIDANRVNAIGDVWDDLIASLGRQAASELTVDPFASAPEDIAVALGIEPGAPVIRRHRVRLVDREPWMISVGWWPRWLGEGNIIEQPRNRSLLSEAIRLGHAQVRSGDLISARMPTVEEAKTLSIPRGVPVIENARTGWDAENRPIRCTVDVFPANRFKLSDAHEEPNP